MFLDKIWHLVMYLESYKLSEVWKMRQGRPGSLVLPEA